ncbi:MAG: ABC transporter substrate-binding protein [Bacteroidales bacterium]|jgi:peptide/nickel transport system substrate-binding protein
MAPTPNLAKTEHNPEKARQLLVEAGYPDGFTTMLHSWVYIVPADWINAVAAQLSDVGIVVTTDFPEVGKYMSDATNG